VLHQQVHGYALQQQLVMLFLQAPGCKATLVAFAFKLQQQCQVQQAPAVDSNQAQRN
jgi:hypothetical protein